MGGHRLTGILQLQGQLDRSGQGRAGKGLKKYWMDN